MISRQTRNDAEVKEFSFLDEGRRRYNVICLKIKFKKFQIKLGKWKK